MKNKKGRLIPQFISGLIFIFLISLTVPTWGWGYRTHYQITKQSIIILEKHLDPQFKEYQEYISSNSSLPDIWKSYYDREGYGLAEGPNHFCDYDYLLKLKKGDLDRKFEEVTKDYTTAELRKGGTVIWAIEGYSYLLKRAFEEKNFQDAMIYIAVLAHYVEDIHQPLHTTENYDGQLTGNTGIHLRYEIRMMDKFWNQNAIKDYTPERFPVKDVRSWTIQIIESSIEQVPHLLKADNIARKQDRWYSNTYYEVLWEETEDITEQQTVKAAKKLSDLIYSIWFESGKPDIPSSRSLKSPNQLLIDRVVFFSSTDKISEAEKKNELVDFSYSLLAIGVFALAVFLLK